MTPLGNQLSYGSPNGSPRRDTLAPFFSQCASTIVVLKPKTPFFWYGNHKDFEACFFQHMTHPEVQIIRPVM